MARTKQRSGSAVQRREQVRQQRQERLNTEKAYPGKERKRRGRKKANNPWPLIVGILVMCALVIGAFVWLSNRPTGGSSSDALHTITHLDPSLLDTVGAGSAQSTFKAIPADANIPQGADGKPQVLYVGADYCPYCAAQRWAIIGALSRFGSFGPINQLTSSESSIPTFTFRNVTYTSKYVDFAAVETADNQGKALDSLNATQTSLMNTYDSPPYTSAQAKGTIPFMVIGNKQVANGAFYDPQVLSGLSYDDINSKITDSTSTVARGMLGATNDLTAAICQATNNQPANVCSSSTIQSIEASLPQPAKASAAMPQLASSGTLPDMIAPKRD